jgi:broad specificity phosphatase PhoE
MPASIARGSASRRSRSARAIVTHGLVCRSLAANHLILPDGATAPEKWDNTSLTIIDWPAPWRVRLLNCVAHLDDLDAAPLAGSGAV